MESEADSLTPVFMMLGIRHADTGHDRLQRLSVRGFLREGLQQPHYD
jgi:hypothetical protein